MANKDVSESSNSNRFKILDDGDENENEPEIKIQKPPSIFVDGVSNIQQLYEILNKSAKNSYDIKIVSSDQVKIQLKNSEIYRIAVKELEDKQTQFYTYKPK